jgi:hypothetical protein
MIIMALRAMILAKLVALVSAPVWLVRDLGEFVLTRRQALPRLHPLDESRQDIADGPADADVRWAVAAHARLGKPGDADLEKPGRLLGREQYDGRRRRFLCRRSSGRRRLRGHFRIPDWR